MKILLLADIHANWPALNAVPDDWDICLFLGDLVDYGTDPVPCIDWVREKCVAAVRGNHDHAVSQHVDARGTSGFRELAAATRPLHWQVLNNGHLKFLARLPVTQNFRCDDRAFHLVHATPWDPLDEYLMEDRRGWEDRLVGVEADFVCVGHTHVQFHLDLGRTQVINPGSVGQPRDGDPRCAYAVIENGKVSLRRVAYDIDATIRQMREAGLDSRALEMAESALRTGGRLPVAERVGSN